MAGFAGSFGSISTVFTYFNPTKSQYYTVAVAACIALAYSCDVTNEQQWLWLAVPSFVVAALTLWLSMDGQNTLTREEHSDQLRFARSTCISIAVLALAVGGEMISSNIPAGTGPCRLSGGSPSCGVELLDFWGNVAICCIQICLFLIYSWALNKQDLPPVLADRNYVQITLLTSAFLLDTSTNLVLATSSTDKGYLHHEKVAIAVGSLWLCCLLFWLVKLAKLHLVQLSRPMPVMAERN